MRTQFLFIFPFPTFLLLVIRLNFSFYRFLCVWRNQSKVGREISQRELVWGYIWLFFMDEGLSRSFTNVFVYFVQLLEINHESYRSCVVCNNSIYLKEMLFCTCLESIYSSIFCIFRQEN